MTLCQRYRLSPFSTVNPFLHFHDFSARDSDLFSFRRVLFLFPFSFTWRVSVVVRTPNTRVGLGVQNLVSFPFLPRRPSFDVWRTPRRRACPRTSETLPVSVLTWEWDWSLRTQSRPGSPSTVGVLLPLPWRPRRSSSLLPTRSLRPTPLLYKNLHTPSSSIIPSVRLIHKSLPFRYVSCSGLTRGPVDLPSSKQVSPDFSLPERISY